MCNILIHEPEAIISLELKSLLKDHKLYSSTSTNSLINLLRKQKYDLVIVDISRIEGWSHLIKLIKKCKVPVIILSTFPPSYFQNIIGSEESLIELPFDPDLIVKVVNQIENLNG
jgi:DNA-binding response OmpR family regulator